MATRSIIKKLHRAIKENQSQDIINAYSGLLIENIIEASEEPIFYSLPFDQIFNIIQKVEFLNPNTVKDPLTLLQTLIQETSKKHPTEAVLLLNVIKVDNLPPLLPDDIIPIISKFTNCQLLTKLGELHEYNKHLLTPAPEEQENEELKEEITKLKQKIDELHKKIKELEEQIKTLQAKETKKEDSQPKKETPTAKENEFWPISEKPKDFVENVFEAVEKGKLDSVQYHFEVLHANKEKTCGRVLPGDDDITRGLTALHIAAAHGQLPVVQYLCEVAKVNTEEKDNQGRTPLYYACSGGNLPVVQYLREVAKVNTEATDYIRIVPLHWACEEGHLQIVQYLCEVAKVNPEAKNYLGWTPLHYACKKGHLSVVQYLCEVAKVKKEAKDNREKTALHFACRFGNLPVVQYLCEVAKVNIEAKDERGRTPLHFACEEGHLPVVQYLCEVAKVNTEGAYEKAKSEEVKEYLKKYL